MKRNIKTVEDKTAVWIGVSLIIGIYLGTFMNEWVDYLIGAK